MCWPREVDFLDHHSTNHAESHHAPLPLLWHGTGDVEMVSGFTFIIATCFGVVISWPQWWVESRVSVKIHNFSWFVSVKCRPIPHIFLGFDSPCSMGERTSWPVGLTFFSGPIVLHFNVCFTNNFWSRFHVWCLKSSFFFYVVGPHELVNFPLRRTSPFFLVNIPLFCPFFKYLFDGSEKMSTSDRSNWKWWSIDWRISKTVFFQFMKDGSKRA